MADYYPLIVRAVGGLDKNTGENRRALYERARGALVNQLRSVDPPLNESDITKERLALEESIRKVEAEAAKRAREAAVEPEEMGTSLRDQGLRDFRDTMKETEGLGDATAEANRSAHAAYDAVPSDRQPAEIEPSAREPAAAEPEPYVPPHSAYFEPAPSDVFHTNPAESAHEPAHDLAHEPHGDHERGDDSAYVGSGSKKAGAWSPKPAPSDDEEDPAYARPPRDWSRVVKILLLLLVIGGIAGAGYWQRNAILSMVSNLRATMTASTPAPKPTEATQPAGRPKIADRIGGDITPSNATAPAASVAQKVVLYDEDPNDPQGKRYVGSALWRTETVSPGPGLAPELAIRADVEIPERRLRMTWSLRRNTDKALPASHTIEVMFTLPADFAEGGIGNVPGILAKQNEQARGAPLAGLAVKVTNGYFLIGLSAVDVDVTRNIQLLKERDWFDIPVVYTSGKRAILAIEKGTPGARAFEEAFRAWGQ
ncbi:MAG TPA: hypothetical protein VGM57_02655 [Pseudolabrys sp.]|jgi:hypothetical protein